jgi:hypothetical protein
MQMHQYAGPSTHSGCAGCMNVFENLQPMSQGDGTCVKNQCTVNLATHLPMERDMVPVALRKGIQGHKETPLVL